MKSERFHSLTPARDISSLVASMGSSTSRTRSTAGNWYTVRNLSAAETEIMLYDEIGQGGTTASDFIRELQDIKAQRITLRVNSPGGEVFDGIAIFNAIRRHPAHVTAYVDGVAASAASFIAMAGDKVVMSPHAELFIHDAHGLTLGNASDMRQMADMLDKSSDNIAGIYAARAGGTVEDWRQKMRAETWYTDHDAVAAGLADEIDGVTPQNRVQPTTTRNEAPPAAVVEPVVITEPEPVQEPVVVDFHRVLEEIEEDAALGIFAVA